MTANVSWMASAHNNVPWHKTNYTLVKDAMTSEEALRLAKLDYDVIQEPVYDVYGKTIKGYRANYKSDDRTLLGMVTDRYKVVQNTESFQFTDALIGDGCRYETAGSINNFKTTWLLAQLEPRKYLGDKFNSFLCFMNSFDGSGAIKVCVTPIRVVCQNTLNMAIRTAKRSFSIKHVGNIEDKLKAANDTLKLSDDYLTCVNLEYMKLAKAKMTANKVEQLWEQLFPIDKEKDTQRKVTMMERQRDAVREAYKADDLANFIGTGYGVVNAVSDMISHSEPMRITDSYYGNLFGKVMEGHPLLDKAQQLVYAMAE
jgi:phage/plasmid-like protein (TIGR03299 family)